MDNLIGEKFNRLLVIGKDDKQKRNVWICKCDCGNITLSSKQALKSGHKKSCGCLQKEKAKSNIHLTGRGIRKNISGKKFGRLTAICEYERIGPRTFWYCHCDCGNDTIVNISNLSKGNVKSCGCLLSEMSRDRILNFLVDKIGKNHPRYNNSISDEEREKGRCFSEYYIWRNSIFERDCYVCQICFNGNNKYLNAHHIESYHKVKEKRLDINNGISMCKKCHILFHNIYGNTNDFDQLINFIVDRSLLLEIKDEI